MLSRPACFSSPQLPRRAFSLVEALIALTIMALAGSVLLLSIESSLHSTTEAVEQTIADGLQAVGPLQRSSGCRSPEWLSGPKLRTSCSDPSTGAGVPRRRPRRGSRNRSALAYRPVRAFLDRRDG